MKTVEVELLGKLFDGMSNGRIRPEHLEMFIEKPDAVFAVNKWKESMIGLLPDGVRIASTIICADGKPLYVAKVEGRQSRVIWGKGESLLYVGEIDSLQLIDGKPLYIVRNYDEQFVVHGEERSEGFLYVQAPLQFANGKSLYFARDREGATFVVNGGKKSKAYHGVYCLQFADGKPLYIAATDRGGAIKRVVVHGTEEGEGFEDVSDLRYTDGRLFYAAWRGRERYYFRDTTIVAPVMSGIGDVQYANGQPLYVLRHDDRVVVVFGRVSTVSFGKISCLQCADGKPLYVGITKDHGNRSSIIWGNEVIANEADGEVADLQLVDGNPLYTIRYVSGDIYVVHGRERSMLYRSVSGLKSVADLPVFVGQHSQKYFVTIGVLKEGLDESRPYDTIHGLTVDSNGVSFIGINKRRILNVTRSL